jgi:GTP-binding protein
VTSEFHELGLGEPVAISSAHGDGVREAIDALLERIAGPVAEPAPEEVPSDDDSGPRRIKIAIVGRPNVGKSTLVNALLGEERVIVFDLPGTTRDSIHIDFDRGGKPYTLIDTAGLRRRGKVFEAVEKFSVVKTLQSVADANVVVLVLDARQEISDQDAHIAGFVVESGRAVVVAINKWDGLEEYGREQIKREAARKLQFLSFARTCHISALKGQGIGAVMRAVDGAAAAAFSKLSTPRLTRALIAAVDKQTPPRRGLSRPKLRYAHQGGQNPPVIVVHGHGLDQVPETYRRYLEATFRETFSLEGTPLRVEFRSGRNPFAT